MVNPEKSSPAMSELEVLEEQLADAFTVMRLDAQRVLQSEHLDDDERYDLEVVLEQSARAWRLVRGLIERARGNVRPMPEQVEPTHNA